jgi:protein-S-isoprenylcysteine O-methyltransferase Ste14
MNTPWGVFSWILFAAGSAGILYASRRALNHPRSHGFYRFFAWEILLILLLVNLPGWFKAALAWHQLISWALLVISLGLVISAIRQLEKHGAQDKDRSDPTLLGMEKTTRLVTGGLYRYIRHPLYSSLLFLTWGVFFKSPSWPDAALALLCSAFLYITARIEEGENCAYFGEAYTEYIQHSKMFVPFIV